ncbi:DNA-binding protein [Pedobacter ginsenosidimutans]|uniref:DNA-binding protein n=1 Tax=Pedobacter ginsenosidimutans TaxID=687842 RepID=A0A0T5VTL3_9SPHI|nr:DUF2310 family Zn-ribbon-containing protein [Pedobacter ginsenosidimutans]KRT16533.1 DNA-binding protein [Pedobacter ginsenosidimutans]
MYIQEISIDIKTKLDKDELIDEFGILMSCLPFTLEKNSLDRKFNNFYVNRQTKKIEDLCNSRLRYKTIGKSYDSYKSPCKCKKSHFYILITNYITIESPLTCGACNKSVPLYRLPIYYDHGYMPILRWETNYISCDRLQMNCEIGERWALNQMQEIKSQLSKQGLEICRKIEELTSIPTFYYLHNYKKYKEDQLTRPCPGCNKKWNLKTQLNNQYDFKCDECKIISTISPNI